jgi:hypothetical protein
MDAAAERTSTATPNHPTDESTWVISTTWCGRRSWKPMFERRSRRTRVPAQVLERGLQRRDLVVGQAAAQSTIEGHGRPR